MKMRILAGLFVFPVLLTALGIVLYLDLKDTIKEWKFERSTAGGGI